MQERKTNLIFSNYLINQIDLAKKTRNKQKLRSLKIRENPLNEICFLLVHPVNSLMICFPGMATNNELCEKVVGSQQKR